MATPVYAAILKKYIVAFASLFDEISYYTEDTVPKLIRVPLVYAPREKWMVRTLNKSAFDIADGKTSEIKMTYPAMAFEMLPFNYAPERASNPQNRIYSELDSSFSLNRIPYDFPFNLYITTKKLEDSYKIIEQIVPFFTPEYSVTITDNIMGLKNSVSVVLNSTTNEINYESDFTTTRDILWTLNFTMKGYLYPAIQQIESNIPVVGSVCTIIESYPGMITFNGTGTTETLCTGGTDDFTFTFTGYLGTESSTFTGTFTSNTSEETSVEYSFPIICQIVIKRGILYGEVTGTSNNQNHPIKAISFTFNFDVSKGKIETQECKPINGFVSCTNSGRWKLIKKTIVDVTPDMVNAVYDRLVSYVDPFTASKTDEYDIIDQVFVVEAAPLTEPLENPSSDIMNNGVLP